MKTKRVAAILLMFLLALSHIAAQDDERKITPLEFKPDFVARELEAVPEIRSKLGLLRLEIDSKELGFIVGYTTAMDFDIPQITGLKPPANLDAILRSNPTPFIGARRSSEPSRMFLSSERVVRSRFDWRNQDGASGVRDQGACGSCWAFATLGAFEGAFMITSGAAELDASEEDLVRCSGSGSCLGGWWAFDYLVDEGIASEEDYPYTATDGTCERDIQRFYKALEWGYVGSMSVDDLKTALVQYGPLAVAVRVTPLFQAYIGGVFDEAATGDVNHGVTLIGWDDFDGAWIIKNSWGAGWGENGYMRIKFGSNSIGYGAAWVKALDDIPLWYEGDWRNVDPDTRGITRTVIEVRGGSAYVHAWGSCFPTDCDWGEVKADTYYSSVNATFLKDITSLKVDYDKGFSETILTIIPYDSAKIQITALTHYKDGSGRSDLGTVYIMERE